MTASAAANTATIEMPFNRAMSLDGVKYLRSSLDVSENNSLVAFYAFLMMDRAAMVQALSAIRADAGEDEVASILKALSGVRDKFERLTDLAEMIEARALIAAHVAFGMTIDETSPTSAWDEAVAIEVATRARLDATPIGSAGDEKAFEAWTAAVDFLIEKVPAPDNAALVLKMELAFERSEGFELFDRYSDALRSDARALRASA